MFTSFCTILEEIGILPIGGEQVDTGGEIYTLLY
jgi:hypothetical protein